MPTDRQLDTLATLDNIDNDHDHDKGDGDAKNRLYNTYIAVQFYRRSLEGAPRGLSLQRQVIYVVSPRLTRQLFKYGTVSVVFAMLCQILPLAVRLLRLRDASTMSAACLLTTTRSPRPS